MVSRPLPPECLALQNARRQCGWSVERLAAVAGVSPHVIYHYERGATVPERALLFELTALMGFPPERLAALLEGLGEGQAPPALGPRSPLDLAAAEEEALERGAGRLLGLLGPEVRGCAAGAIRERKVAAARARAAEVVADLLELAPAERRQLVEHEPGFAGWAVVERLCEESVRAAAADAGRAVAIADLAVLAAGQKGEEPAWRAVVLGTATGFLANARRVHGDLPEARDLFADAWRHWDDGKAIDPHPFGEWRLLDLEASLLRDGGHFADSLERLDRACKLAPEREAGRILLMKAGTLEQMGEPERALAALTEADAGLDPGAEPRLGSVLLFNRAVNLCHLGRFAEARSLLPALEHRIAGLDGLDELRLLWLSGRVAAGLGDLAAAVAALSRVRSELGERKIDYDFAVVSLDLAAVLLDRGDYPAVLALTRELRPILARQQLHRQARGAVKLFAGAVAGQTVTAALARKLAAFLRRLERVPELPEVG